MSGVGVGMTQLLRVTMWSLPPRWLGVDGGDTERASERNNREKAIGSMWRLTSLNMVFDVMENGVVDVMNTLTQVQYLSSPRKCDNLL